MSNFRSLWSRYKLPIKVILVVGIIAILATRMDWNSVGDIIADIRPEYFVIAMLCISGQVLMLAMRWKYFMNAEEHLVDYKEALNMSVASQLANFLFVTSVGGVVLRLFLARHYGLSILKSVCAVVGDRLMTFFAMLSFALAFLPVLTHLLPSDKIDASMVEMFAAIPVLIILGLIALKISYPYIKKNEAIYASLIYLGQLFKKPRLAAGIILSSLIAQGLFFLAAYMAAAAIGQPVEFIKFMALLPFISLASSLPIGFGGWGIREGAFVVALGFLDIPMEGAFLISVQVGILSILGTLLIAIPLILTGDLPRLFRLSKTKQA